MDIDFIPDRLNEEPVIFIGMTDTELKVIGSVSVVFWFPVCMTISGLAGLGVLGIGMVLLMSAGTLFVLGKAFRRLKRGKPKRYHVDRVVAFLEDAGLKSRTFIHQSQVWDIRKHRVGLS